MDLRDEAVRRGQPVRLRAIVRGRVQAVGYRFFVIMHAKALGVTGYAKNLPDPHEVEVVAEGPSEALKSLLHDLELGPSMSRVDSIDVEWLPATGEFAEFDARF